jgi:hypothetical protein
MVDGRVHPATMPMSSPALNSAAMRGPGGQSAIDVGSCRLDIELMTFQTRDRIRCRPGVFRAGQDNQATLDALESAARRPFTELADRVGDTWPLETRPSLPECAGAASGCVLLPGIPHLGLEHRAAWAETKPDGTVTPRWSVGSAWIRSAIPTPRFWRCCWPRKGTPTLSSRIAKLVVRAVISAAPNCACRAAAGSVGDNEGE